MDYDNDIFDSLAGTEAICRLNLSANFYKLNGIVSVYVSEICFKLYFNLYFIDKIQNSGLGDDNRKYSLKLSENRSVGISMNNELR